MITCLLCAALAQLPTPPPPPAGAADAGPAVPASATPHTEKPAVYEGLTPQRLAKIQRALQREKLDAWLFYDFRRSDEIAFRLLGLDPSGARSRRWYCLVPAHGAPRKLVHAIEPRALDGVPGATATYASWRTRDRELGALLRGMRRVAMDYSPRNEIPTVARVDGGTLELVRSLGPEVVSSADLVAELSSTLTPEELASQAQGAELLSADLEAVAQEAVRRIREGRPATERDLQEFARARWAQEGFDAEGWPGVAVDAHSADPHYWAPASGGAVADRGSLLLLDFSTHLLPDGIYADLTRVYFLGESVPEEIQRIAGNVFQARDAAVQLLRQRADLGKLPTGAELDAAARNVIAKAGYADRFLHRTGHSMDHHGHGDGVNNDDFETRDNRRHIPDTCFSIEPGIYLSGRFGIRSEIDVCLPGGRVELRGGPGQSSVPALLAP
ncbi:MAG TPA: M24 family metallopeptidase [Myxococcales bacterium]|nr:M24 family metallopeptidase [Myxococcales bacterium]